MFIEVTKDTNIEDLILLGANVDGKIIQQVTLANLGLKIPRTFFFNGDVISKINVESVEFIQDFTSLINSFPVDKSYQIRTQTIETTSLSDVYAETIVGIAKAEISENLKKMFQNSGANKNLVGLIQEIPKDSLNRDTVSGSMQIIKMDESYKIFISMHLGIATYISRSGIEDLKIEVDLIDLKKKDFKVQYHSLDVILENQRLELYRNSIKLLTKKFKTINLPTPINLPFNIEKNRYKKEYEYSDKELSSKASFYLKNDLRTLINEINNELDLIKNYLKLYNIKLNENINLSDFLVALGLFYIFKYSDEYNSVKKVLKYIVEKSSIEGFVEKKYFDELIDAGLRLGKEILTSHSCSFSLVYDESIGEEIFIYWDMPLDDALIVQSDETFNENMYWIKSKDSIMKLSNYQYEDIGIDLKVDEDINSDLLFVLDKLKNSNSIKNIYVRYSLLSHLATLIREKGFNVISI